MTKGSKSYFEKLKSHLPIVKDPTVVILRGHLLIEELLEGLIAASLTDATAIRDARLTFFQKLCLARGLIGTANEEDLWKPIELLNGLRNNISHRLPDVELSRKLDPVLKAFFPYDYEEIPNDIYSKSKAMRKGIIFHCAELSGFLKSLKAASNDRLQRIVAKGGHSR